MSERVACINPQLLQWARECSGFSLDDVSKALGKTIDTIIAWESGAAFPTYRQLEMLAERLYKRPIAVFFFPEPPEEKDLKAELRTLPDSEIRHLFPDTLLAIREAWTWQESVRELTASRNPSERILTRDFRGHLDDIENLVREVRDFLQVGLREQQAWPNTIEAFKHWRRCFESVGIFVFKRSFNQRDISGFCLHDEEFPIIMVNNSTASARQIFTLFHELAHLLYKVSGITKEIPDYVDELSGRERAIEVGCNHFAAEFLLPSSSFPWKSVNIEDISKSVQLIANQYNVSREVVLRRLLDNGTVNEGEYLHFTRDWNKEFEEKRARGDGGGNYYATQATYIGDKFLNLAFKQFNSGRLSLPELAEHLRLKAKNVGRLEEYLVSRK
jgi:Zn-dependent peptidase ImmA (M78 family)